MWILSRLWPVQNCHAKTRQTCQIARVHAWKFTITCRIETLHPKAIFWRGCMVLLETDWFEINNIRTWSRAGTNLQRGRIQGQDSLLISQHVCFWWRDDSRWRWSAISRWIWRREKRNGWTARVWKSKAAEWRHLRRVLRKRKETRERSLQVNNGKIVQSCTS